jgi:hypothetical protein
MMPPRQAVCFRFFPLRCGPVVGRRFDRRIAAQNWRARGQERARKHRKAFRLLTGFPQHPAPFVGLRGNFALRAPFLTRATGRYGSMPKEAVMHDRFAPLAIGMVWGITIAAVLGTALVDNAGMVAGVGLALASVMGSILFTLADQPTSAVPAAMPKPIPNPGNSLPGRSVAQVARQSVRGAGKMREMSSTTVSIPRF